MNQTACDECRARKFRCSKDRPSCIYCSKQAKKCVYSSKISRSPLTREYVTALERRLQRLEAKYAELHPGADFESILSPESSTAGHSTWSLSDGDAESSCFTSVRFDGRSDESPDLLPEASNGFEWNENGDFTSQLSDGMAALSVDPQGVGFLGSSANVALLRSLHRNGWRIHPTSTDSLVLPESDTSTASWSWDIMGQPSSRRQVEGSLIEAYFFHYHQIYPCFHEPTFRAQYSEVIPRPRFGWDLLLGIVVRVGAWCIGSRETDGNEFLQDDIHALAMSSSTISSANLTLVQAFSILSNFTQRGKNMPNTGWNYLGLAVRMAISLGLHKEFPDWNISLLDREMRRRAFWQLFIFESGASITLGRPILLPPPDITDVKEPLNIHDEYLTPSTTIIPAESDKPTLYSNLLIQVRFHKLVSHMYSRRISSTDIPADEVLTFNTVITNWLSASPSYFQEDTEPQIPPEWLVLGRYRIFWRVRNFRILMLCPVLLRWANERARGTFTAETDTKSHQLCRQLCLRYAHQTIASVVEYVSRNIFSPQGDWYATYFLFQALWIPITVMLADPDSPIAAECFSDVEAAKEVLESVGSRDALARKFLDVVNKFCPSMEVFTGSEMGDAAIQGTVVLGQEQLLSQIYSRLQGPPVGTGIQGTQDLW